MRFEPHDDVKGLISNEHHGDMAFLDDLEGIPSNLNLYNMYAWNAPEKSGGVEAKIGTLKLNGGMYRSRWADEDLFFRHQRMNDDFKWFPAWDGYSPRYSLNGKCPFDLGF